MQVVAASDSGQVEPPTGGSARWEARLEVLLRHTGRRTYVARRRHSGPLVMQRPFLEPSGVCQIYLVHPPGGLVGGDQVRLLVRAEPGASGLLTTPGATKVYRSAEREARLAQDFEVEAGACIEWLPQETIAYKGLNCRANTRVQLHGDGQFVGWEVNCLGQDNQGLTAGELTCEWEVARDGRLLWCERAHYVAGAPLLVQPWGLGGRTVVGTMVATLPDEPSGQTGGQGAECPAVQAAREALATWPGDCFSVSRVGGVVLVRYWGGQAQQALAGFRSVWRTWRETLLGVAPWEPRVWAT